MMQRITWVETVDPLNRDESAVPTTKFCLNWQINFRPKRLVNPEVLKLPDISFDLNFVNSFQMRAPYLACAEQNIGFFVPNSLCGFFKTFLQLDIVDNVYRAGLVR